MNLIVVTGAAGFVGSAVINELLKNKYKVIALDIVDNPVMRLPLGNENLNYFSCDVSNIMKVKEILRNYNPDVFYHFAWVGSAGPLREDYKTQVNNALLTVSLLEMAKELKCKRFICAGSIMEYESHNAIYDQESKPAMAYLYGIGKQLAYSLCKPVANRIGIDLVWAHITNTYGVGEKSPRLINNTIIKCINNEVLIFTEATQNYDFIYIDDVARAFRLLGEKGKANSSYIIGSGNAQPLRKFLLEIVDICNEKSIVNFGSVPYTGINLPLNTFSTDLIRNDCDFAPHVSFQEGIKLTHNWLKEVIKNDK